MLQSLGIGLKNEQIDAVCVRMVLYVLIYAYMYVHMYSWDDCARVYLHACMCIWLYIRIHL